MAYRLEITHFSVGQGLCVLIQLRSDSGVFLGLLDMGTLSNADIYANEAIESIQNVLDNNDKILNYVHISHLDSDHYNLFKKLSIVRIKKLIIGGNRQNVTTNMIFPTVSQIDKIYRTNQNECFPGQDPYMTSSRDLDTEVNLGNNFFFRINTLIYRADVVQSIANNPSLKINTGSSIVLVSVVYDNRTRIVPGISYLFTGDSTCYTLAQFNELEYQLKEQGDRIIQVPHHGTERNMIENSTFLESFLRKYSPTTAVVSAKCLRRRGWVHPAKSIMDIYHSTVARDDESHLFTSFRINQCNNIEVVSENIKASMFCTFRLPINYNGQDYTLKKELGKKELGNDFSGYYSQINSWFENDLNFSFSQTSP